MKQTRKLLHVLVLAATTAALLPSPSHGRSIDPGAAAETQYDSAVAPPALDSWVGAGAAIGCGFGIRVSRMTRNPYVAVGTLLLCLVMLADGIASG